MQLAVALADIGCNPDALGVLDRSNPEQTWLLCLVLLVAVYGSCAPAELKALCYPD